MINHVYLASLGSDLIPEDVTNRGRIDINVKRDKAIYIIECKVDDAGKALEQIKAKNYQKKYLNANKPIYLIGIDFDSARKNVAGFEWEVL